MKGIVYYTNNKCDERILLTARELMLKSGLPIISVSHYPIDFGNNVVVSFKSGKVSMFKQILIGLEKADFDTVFCCEHDVLYHKSHFDFTPPRKDVYYFNTNVWTVDSSNGKALWYNDPKEIGRKMTSGLVANRELIIDHYRYKLEQIEKKGKFSHRELGYAPGKADKDAPSVRYQSEYPNIDVKHGNNITPTRFDLSQFGRRSKIKDSWKIENNVPGWGKTRKRFEGFLKECFQNCQLEKN